MTHLSTERFAPQHASVASETVDGVAILINLSTGAYYSMEQSAATHLDVDRGPALCVGDRRGARGGL